MAIAAQGPEILLAGGRYTGRSGGTRLAVPSPRSGISDTFSDGGYGFTRKSFFKNSENNRSQFRNGFAKRSFFGQRYDRVSKLDFGRNAPTDLIRPLPPAPRLDVWQPAENPSFAPPEGAQHPYPGRGQANPQLSAKEIEKRISGRSLQLELTQLGSLEGRFEPDGTAAYHRGEESWNGSWAAEDSRLCLKMTETSAPSCYQVAMNGPQMMFFMASGAPAGRASFDSVEMKAAAPQQEARRPE